MALPLITTSVTRHVKVDAHATKIGSMILGEGIGFVYGDFCWNGNEGNNDEENDKHAHLRNTIIVTIAFFTSFAKADPSLLLLLPVAA